MNICVILLPYPSQVNYVLGQYLELIGKGTPIRIADGSGKVPGKAKASDNCRSRGNGAGSHVCLRCMRHVNIMAFVLHLHGG